MVWGKFMLEEKYYWTKEDGTKIPVHELTDLHICNIVMKFGKDNLHEMGHSVIADKFTELNRKYKFFNMETTKTIIDGLRSEIEQMLEELENETNGRRMNDAEYSRSSTLCDVLELFDEC